MDICAHTNISYDILFNHSRVRYTKVEKIEEEASRKWLLLSCTALKICQFESDADANNTQKNYLILCSFFFWYFAVDSIHIVDKPFVSYFIFPHFRGSVLNGIRIELFVVFFLTYFYFCVFNRITCSLSAKQNIKLANLSKIQIRMI